MTDTLPAEGARPLKQAVVFLDDDKPYLELTAEEFIFPVLTSGDRFKLYFHVRPYEPYAVKRFYDQVIPPKRRMTATKVEIQSADYTQARAFVLAHLLALSGVRTPDGSEPTLEIAKGWLQENPSMLIRAFREGFDAVAPRDVELEPNLADGPVLLFGRRDHRVPTEFVLFSRERQMDVKVQVVHALERLTEADRHQWDKATRVVQDNRINAVLSENNWDVIEGLYNQRAKSLEGALLDGQPCTDANREHWIKRVPFIHKAYVINFSIGEIELGNA